MLVPSLTINSFYFWNNHFISKKTTIFCFSELILKMLLRFPEILQAEFTEHQDLQ
jgi:hypothetical protein